MDPQTPDWVRDAVFYQIFPDRFARSPAVPKPRHLDEWGSPPTYSRIPGGRPARRRRASGLSSGPGRQRHLLHADLPVGVEPPLSHARLREGRSDARRQRGAPAAHRRGPRARHPGRARRRLQPRQPGLLPVPRHHGKRPRLGLPRLVPRQQVPAQRLSTPDEKPNYGAWWGLPALPKFNTGCPEVREFLWGIARKWIEFGIDGWRLDVPNEIDDDSFWREFRHRVKAGNPDAYIVGEVWTDAPRWLQGDMWDAVMNYHFTRACIAFFIGEEVDEQELRRTSLFPPGDPGAEAFRKAIERLIGLYAPSVTGVMLNLLGSHDMARFLTLARGDRSALRLATTFQMTYPGRSVDLLRRRDRHARRPRPGQPRRLPLAPHRELGHRPAPRLPAADRAAPIAPGPPPGHATGSCTRAGDLFAHARQLGDETIIVVLQHGTIPRPARRSSSTAWLPDGTILEDVWSHGRRSRSSVEPANRHRTARSLILRHAWVLRAHPARESGDAMNIHRVPPPWRLPEGVNVPLWEYLHTPRLAVEEDAYFAGHPLFAADARILDDRFVTPGRLVDLGCGAGRHAIRFASRGFPVVAVDLSRPMLETVERKAEEAGVSLLTAPGEPLPAGLSCRRARSITPCRCSARWG